MSHKFTRLLSVIASLCMLSVATASVRTLPISQFLRDPANPASTFFSAWAVAIDGDSIIVISDDGAQRSALLYRRGTDSQWAFERYLLQVPSPTNTNVRPSVTMKNFIAVIKLNEVVTIWEKQSGNWVQAATDAPIRQPGGFAISTNRVMVGADGCTDDALIYQKSATGIWGITGRVPRGAGVCSATQVRYVDLNYDNALVRTGNVLRGYRRNGSTPAWPASFTLNLTNVSEGAPAMQSNTIVLPGGTYYRLTSSGPVRGGELLPLNAANGAGGAYDVLYRDSVLLTSEWIEGYRTVPRVYAWVPNSSGGFDQVAVTPAEVAGRSFDISHDTIVAATSDYFGYGNVEIINLPTPAQAPRPYVNNFETRDISALDQPGTPRFKPASDDLRNTVLRYQMYANSHGYALLRDSDWPVSQSVTARIISYADRALQPQNAWAGLALRHTDESNTYVASVSGTNVANIAAIINGRKTILARLQLAAYPTGKQFVFSIVGDKLSFQAGPDAFLTATDSRLKTGRAGLVSFATFADFDDVIIAPTEGFNLLYRNYNGDLTNGGPLTQLGGTWVVPGDGGGYLQQTNTSQQALYLGGTPTHDQVLTTEMRLDQFGSTDPVAWIGLVARYVDARTFYYLSARSSGQLQVRKTVDGVTTVLGAKAFTPAVGAFHRYKFEVVGEELRAYVDDVLVLSVRDSAIASGKYGVGSYRAAASWKYIAVSQP